MPLKSIGNKLNEKLVQASHSFVYDQERDDLIDATCPPLVRIVSEIADSKSKSIPGGRRLKIFEKITTSDEENLLESEKQNDN